MTPDLLAKLSNLMKDFSELTLGEQQEVITALKAPRNVVVTYTKSRNTLMDLAEILLDTSKEELDHGCLQITSIAVTRH